MDTIEAFPHRLKKVLPTTSAYRASPPKDGGFAVILLEAHANACGAMSARSLIARTSVDPSILQSNAQQHLHARSHSPGSNSRGTLPLTIEDQLLLSVTPLPTDSLGGSGHCNSPAVLPVVTPSAGMLSAAMSYGVEAEAGFLPAAGSIRLSYPAATGL